MHSTACYPNPSLLCSVAASFSLLCATPAVRRRPSQRPGAGCDCAGVSLRAVFAVGWLHAVLVPAALHSCRRATGLCCIYTHACACQSRSGTVRTPCDALPPERPMRAATSRAPHPGHPFRYRFECSAVAAVTQSIHLMGARFLGQFRTRTDRCPGGLRACGRRGQLAAATSDSVAASCCPGVVNY